MHINSDCSATSAVVTRWALQLACVLATACFNPDDRCGEGQKYSAVDQLCVCRAGLTLTANGCEKPPKEPGNTASAGAGAGATTDQDAAAPPGESGPEGLGTSCTSNDDCAGSDATFCDAVITGGCLVEGCALGGSDCPVGYECQDLTMFGAAGNVCVAAACDVAADDCPDGFTCCASAIPGFPPACLSKGCGG
jgi:hypothetical protein